MGSTGRVALVCNFGGFVSFLAGLFGFILAGTDIRRNSYMMDNFGRQKFNSEGQFCASHTQTHRHTDTLIFFYSIDKPIGASPRRWLDSSCCLGLLGLLCCDHDDRVFPYNGYGNSMSIYVRNPSASLN